MVLSTALRMAGLTRRVGYRHADRHAYGRGLNSKLEKLAEEAIRGPLTFIFIDALEILRQREKLEEAEWLTREIDQRLLRPLFESALKAPSRLTLAAPAANGEGLAVTFATGDHAANPIPFNEHALDEKSVPTRDVWTVVEDATARVG